jgi:hypothetical protein
MGESDWAAVSELFHRALAQAPDEREAFLDRTCGGQSRLRAEVASLLAAHEQASGFMERPAGRVADLITLARDAAEAAVGQTVGPYVILRTLGTGGMGVVYLAEDTRLARVVALKALAPQFTGDPTRRERLRREARAAAALSHPGIATVYALEEVGDQLYIASEYVSGETLREELRRGALSIGRVLDTAISIARALAAAHDRGLVHRDLKPDNLIRSTRGDMKILDFGIARFRDVSDSPARLTGDGMLLGTPAYMSPEQIRGQAVDFRSDMFSLGIVIYELVAGEHPFAAPDTASTIAEILEVAPRPLVDRGRDGAVSGLADMNEIVATCLQKAPGDRYRSTHALVSALERVQQRLVDSRVDPLASRTRAEAPAAPTARWWWQFHQGAATVAYAGLLYPLWYVHEWMPGLPGRAIFVGALISVLVASALRLHLWFVLRSYPTEWRRQQARVRPWIRVADILFVLVTLVAAALVTTTHEGVAIVLVAASVAALLSFAIIEPATSRAAFGR